MSSGYRSPEINKKRLVGQKQLKALEMRFAVDIFDNDGTLRNG